MIKKKLKNAQTKNGEFGIGVESGALEIQQDGYRSSAMMITELISLK